MGDYFSYSRISLFEKCPKAFEYEYVERETPAFPTTIEAYMGSCVHEAIAKAYDNDADDFDQLLKYYSEAWFSDELDDARVVKRGIPRDHYFEEGKTLLENFFNNVYGEDDGETIATEVEFVLTLRNGTEFHGVIDRISRSEDGTLTLTDYKTGKNVPDPTTDLQLRSYALYAFEEYDDGQIMVRYEDLREGRARKAVIGRKELDRIEGELLARISNIENASHYEAQPSVLCRWCGFSEICPEAE